MSLNSMLCLMFFFQCYGDHRDLHLLAHSFPTRRSSDLGGVGTIHAGSALGALRRMEQLIQEAVVTVPRALLAETIDLVAVLVRDGTGRRLSELTRVDGLDPATGEYRLIPSVPAGDLS